MTFTEVFGGTTIYPSGVSYRAVPLSADQTLSWPVETATNANIVAQIMDVTPSLAALSIIMPPANEASVGETTLFFNAGSFAFTVKDNGGNTIVSIAPGLSYQVYLIGNSTVNGTWRSTQYAAGTSSATAGSLVGAGIKAINTTLNQSMGVTTLNANYTIGDADRSEAFLWAGGAGTLTLPSALAVGNDWFCHIRNSGTGAITLAPTASQLINGATSLAFNPGDSAIVICDGSGFFTIGFGQSASFAFDYVSIDLTSQASPYTLAGANLNRIAYSFGGTLTADMVIYIPATFQQYWLSNATVGGFSITVKVAGQTGVIIGNGVRAICYCNGTDLVDADTSSFSFPVSIAQGGTGATNESGARINLGGTATGIALFTAASAASARSSLSAAASGANSDITSLTGLTTPLSVAQGGTGATTAGTARTALGATTVGGNVFTLTNPSAITFPRFNADNTVSALDAATFRTAIGSGNGTVTTVGFTGGIVSVANPTTTPAFTVAGTSGGIPYFSSASTWATSGALAANAIVIGGGAGVAPATTTTGTGVVTALGINVGSAGAFVTFNGALGTPSSGTLTNCTFPTLNQNTTGSAGSVANAVTFTNTGGAAAGTTFNGSAARIIDFSTVGAYAATNPSGFTSNAGTVTSVGGTGTVSGLTLTGTVIASGNLTLGGTLAVTASNFASQTANTFLCAPNGAAGVPTFRAIVAADIPTLNQNTTGTAANVTGTVAVVNGGTGQTSYTDGQLLIGNSTGNTLTKATLTAGTNITITNGPGSITINASGGGGGGTVTSVSFTGGIVSVATPTTTPAFTVAGTSGGIPYFSSGSTWATSAALAANAIVVGGGAGLAPATVTTGTGVVTALGVNTGSAGAFVVNGGALGTPLSGTLTNCTFPTLNQNTTGTAANVTGTVAIANGGTGATTAAAARTNFGATTLGSNLFTLPNPGAITFPRFNVDNTVSSLDADALRGAISAGTVTSVSGGTTPVSGLSLTGTVTTSGSISLTGTLAVLPSNFASQTANTFLAAPNGSAGVPTFRAVVAGDIPTLNQNTTGSSGSCTGNSVTATTAGSVTNAVTFNNGGAGAASGTTYNGSAAQTISYNTVGAYAASNPSGYTSNVGTVTSVGGTGSTNGLSLSGTVSTSGNLTLGGSVTSVATGATIDGVVIGYRNIPRSTTTTTAVVADNGKCIAVTAGITIPNSTFAAGDAVSIYNDSASAITITAGVTTLRQAGTTNTGNRTLAARGMATIWFNSATEAIISGAGVT